MKKILLSLAAMMMAATAASAATVVLNANDATNIVGTDNEEVPASGDSNGQARRIQPLESLEIDGYAFTFNQGSASTAPAYYYPMSTNETGNKTIRIYNGSSMTVKAPEGVTFTKIVSDAGDIYSGAAVSEYTFTTTKTYKMNKITVTTAGEGDEPSTPEVSNEYWNPMTVAQAIAYINNGGASDIQLFVKGFITSIKEVSTNYGNATFNIADTADGSENLTVFRCYYLNGDKFTAEDQIKVGDEVVVYGKLVDYNGTPEMNTGGQIYVINGQVGAGVENVEVENNASAVYYNLQGVRVNNPENGLFIVVKGNKATKVVL